MTRSLKLFAMTFVFALLAMTDVYSAVAPTIQARYLTFTNVTTTTARLAWINGNGSRRIVVASTNTGINWATVAAALSNTTEYTDNDGSWLGAPQIGATGAYVLDVVYGSNRVTYLSNLSGNGSYAFHVFDYNVGGLPAVAYNANSAVQNPRTLQTNLLEMTNPISTGVTAYTGDVTWTDPNTPDAASYLLDVATDMAFTSMVPGYNSLSIVGYPYTIVGLNPTTVYYFRVRGVDGIRISNYSPVGMFKTGSVPPTLVAGGATTFCNGSSVTLSFTTAPGLTYTWYKDNVAFVNASNSFVATMPGTYKVGATNVDMIETFSNNIMVTVNPLPATPIASNPMAFCAGGNATITPTAVPGVGFRYYTAATAGTLLSTGASYNTGALTMTTSYFVEAYDLVTMCPSAVRKEVVVTVNPLPANAVVMAPAAICATFSTTITPTAVAGVNFRYYTAAVGGTLLATGASYNTGALLATTNYYVEAFDATTLCIAPARTMVTVTVNPLPASPIAMGSTICANNTATITPTPVAGVAFEYFTALTGGTSLGTGASFTTPLLMATTTYYVEAKVTATGCIAAARTPVVITVNPLPAVPVASATPATICAGSTSTINVTPVAGVQFDFYTAATGGTPFFTGNVYNTPVLTSTTSYYVEAKNTVTMCVSATRTMVTVNVNPLPAAAIVPTPAAICSGFSTTINPTAVAGVGFRYYDAPVAGTLLSTGASYNTGVLVATTNYYVEAYNTTTMCIAPTRTMVTVTVNPLPALPVVAAVPSVMCAGNTSVVSVTPVAGIAFDWFTTAVGGTSFFTGNTYNTPVLNTNTTYYVEARNTTTGCITTSRTMVTITVNPLPALPIVATPAAICSGNSTMVNATPVAGIAFDWFTAPTGGVAFFTGNSYATPVLTNSATYYVEARNTVTGCITTSRTMVTVTVNPLPLAAVATGSTVCFNTPATITPTPVAGINFRYYDAPVAGTLLATGATYTTANLVANMTYWVEAFNATTMCIATSRTAVNIVVTPLVAINVQPTNMTVNNGANVTFNTTVVNANSFQWEISVDGGLIWNTLGGATSEDLSLTAVTLGMSGYQYRLVATGNCNVVTSNVVTLTVMATPPSTQATGIIWNFWSRTEINLSWTRGNGDACLVAIRQGANPVAPTDGATYTANSVYGLGNMTGAGSYVVYNGTGTNVAITGLTRNLPYTIHVFEYNGTGASTMYNTGIGALNNPRTRNTSPKEGVVTGEEFGSNNAAFEVSTINPNPASDIVNFSVFANENANYTIELFNINGERVVASTMEMSAGDNNVILPLDTNLSAGIYSLRISDGIGFITRQVVVVK